jgi:prepilin-type N-terminal cleavage/methylation domain-containing protein
VRRRAGVTRAGMTLAELSVSLAVIATLMVATGSVMVLTGRSVSITAAQAAESRIDDLVSTMASEQRMALTVTQSTPTSVTFTVADRDGDGVPETIRYAYSATTKELTRQVNAGAPVVVAKDVTKFNVAPTTKTVSAAAPVPDIESTTDDILYSHENGTTGAFSMSTLNWCAQSFIAKFPRADVKTWRVTQVQIMGTRTVGATGSWTVGLYAASGSTPNMLTLIDKKTLAATSLPTGTPGWSPVITFTNDHQLSPSDRYCVVISQSGSAVGSVSFDSASTDATGVWSNSGTGGTLWTGSTTRDMRIRVMGRYKSPGS